uniref:MAM domain-containing protein n=1 Tax=Parastrongyloides trichosuri TaxID=131310 RepID=A0A0N4ZHI2_PARTI
MLLFFIVSFIILQISQEVTSNNDMNCDFQTSCCWKEPTLNPFINDILASDIIDLNWYRRTFKVGKSKPPPTKNYLLRSIGLNSTAISIYESCPFCSENGIVNIEFRHWQSPSTKFYVCFKEKNKPVEKENCELVNYILQSKLVDVEFEIPQKTKMTLVFMISNPSLKSEATVMIDHINVRTEYCGLNIKSLGKLTQKMSKFRKTEDESSIISSEINSPIVLTEVPPATSDKIISPSSQTISSNIDKKFLSTPKDIFEDSSVIKKTVSVKPLQVFGEKIIVQPTTPIPKLIVTTTPTVTFTFPTLAPIFSGLNIPSTGLFSFLPKTLQPMTPEFTGFNIKPSKIQKPLVELTTVTYGDMITRNNNNVIVTKKQNMIEVNAAPTLTSTSNTKNNTNDNPFVDMFGQEFAEFLDPSFETNNEENKEENLKITSEVNEQNLVQNKANTAMISSNEKQINNNPINIFDPKNQVCNTIGGCLFDRSFCSYHNVPDLANGGEFRAASVGQSRFIEARLSPGQVAVFETTTIMAEDHFVLFDVLEWVEGEKLSACCITPNRQPSEMVCPYETSTFQGPIEWKAARLVCPKGTTKLMFICENYGRTKGVCAIDNIRLHKTTDTAWSEPCQKNLLVSM